MILTIELENGRYLVNGKRIHELNDMERRFLNEFFLKAKLTSNKTL